MVKRQTTSTPISDTEITDALRRSGYLLEARVEKVLEQYGYYVEANSAYPDPTTQKSRELDLHALAAHKTIGEYGFFFPVLLIECVNNPQPLAFLTKRPLTQFLFYQELKMAGLPVKVVPKKGSREWTPLAEFLLMNKYQHYCKGPVATQFCSFAKKRQKDEWAALHEGPHFDAFQKLCDATAYFQDKHFKSWRFADKESMNVEIYYPVLVVQGRLLQARSGKRTLVVKDVNHVQYRRTVIRRDRAIDYHIDVVTEGYLGRYLSLLDKEVQEMVRRTKRRSREIREAIEKIVAKARRLRSPEKIRAAMDVEDVKH